MGGERVADRAGIAVEPDIVIDLRDPVDPRRIERVFEEPGDAVGRGGRRRGLALLGILNALNLLDATLTYLLIRWGLVYEGNPIVTWMTLPGKIVFVAGCSVLLWKLRPGALIVPAVAYAAVVCYSIVGAFLLS